MATTKETARNSWLKAKRGFELSREEKDACIDAYYSNELPKDKDYSVAQWVEDGCNPL